MLSVNSTCSQAPTPRNTANEPELKSTSSHSPEAINLHGSVFEFLRNSALDARNTFDQSTAERRLPPFQRNQFGGALGGPLRKERLFLFGNYEGFRQRLGLSNVAVVPDQQARQGLLPNANGVYTQVPNLNSAMLPYMTLW